MWYIHGGTCTSCRSSGTIRARIAVLFAVRAGHYGESFVGGVNLRRYIYSSSGVVENKRRALRVVEAAVYVRVGHIGIIYSRSGSLYSPCDVPTAAFWGELRAFSLGILLPQQTLLRSI